MQCPQCQTDNRAGRKFCAACGQALSITCSHCDFVNEPEDRFCGGCGQALTPPTLAPTGAPERPPHTYTPKHLADKILTSRSALEGERKQVTVLFADTAGFTALARDLDPEVVHEVMDHCFGLMSTEIHRFEGTINQYTGDGIMALFGAPIAHEDSPRRAVHAALGMQRAMQDFGRELQAQRGLQPADAHRGEHRAGGGGQDWRRPAHGLYGGGRYHQPGGAAATTGPAWHGGHQ